MSQYHYQLDVAYVTMDQALEAGWAPSYPSSSKVKKDWNKIDKECDELLKDEGGDPAMKLFQQIYANSDEDTRRAMVKSMQESDGKAL